MELNYGGGVWFNFDDDSLNNYYKAATEIGK